MHRTAGIGQTNLSLYFKAIEVVLDSPMLGLADKLYLVILRKELKCFNEVSYFHVGSNKKAPETV